MSRNSSSDRSDLLAALDALRQARVLVVGDAMLDRFCYGSVERISPEAPIPVLRIDRDATMLGGAGNVVRNLAALSVDCAFVAVVGDDDAGQKVSALAAAGPGVDSRLITERGRPTSIKERYIAGAQQLLRADRESCDPLTPEADQELADRALAELTTAKALVLSDYGKGVLGDALLAKLTTAAKDAGKPVVIDPKGRGYGRYRGATVVTPNRRELAEESGLAVADSIEVEAACRAVQRDSGIDAVLATRSAEGMTLVQGEQPARHFAAEAREVFDVSGAGDTVVAVLGAGLAAGLDLDVAARLANLAAGVVVGKVGTAVATLAELRHAMHAAELLASEAKVVGRDALLAQLERWRAGGQSVGFTNGCFDLLHPGHVQLLRQARVACDRLVVGLNSDASVARLKGAGRPVQGESARAVVLASLADVDRVVIFDEDTPLELIAAIRPDVLVKGADYRLDDVVGGDLVQGYGGRVLLAKLAPGHSSTATIEKLGN